jgi:hypothetical protein
MNSDKVRLSVERLFCSQNLCPVAPAAIAFLSWHPASLQALAFRSGSDPDELVAAGFSGFVVLSFLGIRLLIRGIRSDIYDWLGHAPASRFWFIIGGILMQLPLVAWIAFLIHQGWLPQ